MEGREYLNTDREGNVLRERSRWELRQGAKSQAGQAWIPALRWALRHLPQRHEGAPVMGPLADVLRHVGVGAKHLEGSRRPFPVAPPSACSPEEAEPDKAFSPPSGGVTQRRRAEEGRSPLLLSSPHRPATAGKGSLLAQMTSASARSVPWNSSASLWPGDGAS